VAPRTAGEEVLAELWAKALGLERIGVRDNFFVLGGDSMRSVRLIALANERGFGCTVQDLYRYPTVEALAVHLGCGPGEEPALPDQEAELLAMLDELERLDDEEVRERLRSVGSGRPRSAG
jgi:aryl carrier-like protein